jgi:predicted Zn-dependent peptidase
MEACTKVILLDNGIRVLFESIPNTRLVHIAYVFDAGSRDEQPHEIGLAHFTEHMLFKGTKKRRSFHILNRIDSVGGDLNAYTTKEKTQYYATIQSEHAARALELLHDIAFNSVFPEREIERERQVIEEEIEMYADNPEESILEDFDRMLFPNHALGQPILGKREQLSLYTPTNFLDFTSRNYTPERLVVCLTGSLTERQVDRLIQQYLRSIPSQPSIVRERTTPLPCLFGHIQVARQVQQMHAVWGGTACSIHDDNYLPFLVLNYLLGGSALNNRLNLSIRERHGLTYNLYSYYNSYQDCGTWGIYAGFDSTSYERINRLIYKELNALVQDSLTERQLNALKKQYIGQMILNYENPLNRIAGQAKDILDFGSFQSLDDCIEQVESLTSSQLLQAAQLYLNPDTLNALVYQPERR